MAGQLTIDSGDTAWMLVSTALVMLMLLPGPGAVLWRPGPRQEPAVGDEPGARHRRDRDPDLGAVGLQPRFLRRQCADRRLSARPGSPGSTATARGPSGARARRSPSCVFAAFQMSFAAITGALVIGALVERVRFPRDHAVRDAVADDRLRAARAHGVGGRRLPVQVRRDRLRRRHGGAHQFGRRGARRRRLRRTAHRPPARRRCRRIRWR